MLGDLGVETIAEMQRRATEIEAFLPELMALAEDLMAADSDQPTSCERV